MQTTILFPSLFGEMSSPWIEEYEIAKKAGFNVATFEEDSFKINSSLDNNLVIYRGWMISFSHYEKLILCVNKAKGSMLISLSQYQKANSFSTWYNILNRYTMKSYFIRDFDKLNSLFDDRQEYFVKDNLKSLGSKKSIAHSKKEAISIYEKIKDNRDFEIENNGICLREVIELHKEERFFVLNGKILGTHTDINRLDFVKQVVSKLEDKIGLSFISVDVAYSGLRNILVEIGGFQVSDMSKDGDLELVEKYYKEIKESLT